MQIKSISAGLLRVRNSAFPILVTGLALLMLVEYVTGDMSPYALLLAGAGLLLNLYFILKVDRINALLGYVFHQASREADLKNLIDFLEERVRSGS